MANVRLKISPGVSLRASGPGVGGTDGAAVSIGFGPLMVSSRVSTGSTKRKPTTKRTQPAGTDVVKTLENAVLALYVLDSGIKFVGALRADVAARAAARADNRAKQDAERQLCDAYRVEFPAAERAIVPQPTLGLKDRLARGGRQQHDEALRAHAVQQAECDAEWRLLTEHDSGCVIDAINDAFADNAAPSICIDAGQEDGTRYATLVVTFPSDDVVLREVWPPKGNPEPRSDRAVADMYREMVSSIVVASVKEALATAPACDQARVVVVRWGTRMLSRASRLDVIYAGNFDRRVLKVDWSVVTPSQVIGAPAASARMDDSTGKPLRPLPLRKHPDLQALVAAIEQGLTARAEPTEFVTLLD